ncbi:hypothetical protein [Roseateles sp.]|uniref:hypothetical protein n=1 Tax=Roseateles sp. TaxID=1971397 RepID=UPI003BA50A81
MKRQQKRTETEIFYMGFRKPFLQAGDRPFIKQLNWFTGFGKTYTAAVFAIDLFLQAEVIPVFIAPLQSLVKGFADDIQKHHGATGQADEIERLLRERGAAVTVHRLYSRDYHQNDATFFEAVIRLHDWLTSNDRVFSALERAGRADPKNPLAARLAEMRRKARVCLESNFHDLAPSDDTYADAYAHYMKSAGVALTQAEAMTKRLIQLDVDTRTQDPSEQRVMTAPPVADMVRRLQPLQAFLDNPGIIVSTASKSQVQQQVYTYDAKAGRNRWLTFENLPEFLKELNREESNLGRLVTKRDMPARVVMFVDEEEDSYWYLFDQRKSVVNSEGRHDLNVVITEFFKFLDLRWPLAFERPGTDYGLAFKVYAHLEKIAAVSPAVWREFEVQKTASKAKHIPEAKRIALFRCELESKYPEFIAAPWTDEELGEVLKQLIDRNDVHNEFQRFQEKARVLAALREYVAGLDRKPAHSAYRTYKALRELVVDKKYFTMNRASYGEVLDQPSQTFFNGESNVMDTDFLKRVQLSPDTGAQTIQLVYHEDDLPDGAYTLFNYLELVLFIARLLNVDSGDNVITFTKDDLEVYPGLARFRREIRKLFKAKNAEGGFEHETFGDELLAESFFFSGTKSVVTLEESRRQAEEYNLPADVNLTITITSLRDTPEEDILQSLGRSNGVYLMSATGGLAAASTGAFNTKQLQRMLEAKGGVYAEMTDEELAVVGKRANEFLELRQRQVTIIDDTAPATGFEVSGGYKGLKQLFHEAYPEKDEPGYSHLNNYKKHEIDGLVASLDKLLATNVRSGLVLCQTIRRVQKCLVKLANTEGAGVVQEDHDGHRFTIRPLLPTYRKATVDPVTLILYTAERFRKRDSTKTGALVEVDDAGQFNGELVEALNITNHKVLLWTAYGSASRGLDFVTTERGVKKDFELFCLLNDPYYTRHTRPGSRGFSMEMFQSYIQVVRDEDETWPAMSKRDLLYEYSRNRWKRLRKEHFIDITRTIFQALGRGERCPEAAMPKQHILISAQAAQMVHLGVRYAPELARRASPAQRCALQAIQQHNASAAVFASDEQRKAHVADSLKRAYAFREYTSQTPKRFRSDVEARKAWPWLFNTRMFTDPRAYLDELRKHGIPAEFLEGAYLEVPTSAELYTREVSRAGLTEVILADSVDGTDVYDWVGMLAPAGLAEKLSTEAKSFMKARRGFPVDGTDGARCLFPQPWFVTEIMKGYVAEREFERFVEEQFRVLPGQLDTTGALVRYLEVAQHPLEADIFQLYDYYLEVADSDALVAVDVKNWARSTDRYKKEELEAEAWRKHARLQELFPDRRVHAVYVNLHGTHKYRVQRPASGSIRFMSLYVHPSDEWIANDNLVNVLLAQ